MNKPIQCVVLDEDICNGCIHCIKCCPTEAIRVKNQKAVITPERCITCGECIRVCPSHAKKALRDPLEIIDGFKYKVALPHPALYAQFNNLEDKTTVLRALLDYGFDEVFEVAAASETVTEMTRRLISEKKAVLPIISSTCPAVIRLIRLRFPNLIKNISPLYAPREVAASTALLAAMNKTLMPREDIGIILIAPCPGQVASVRVPLGFEKSGIDAVIAISDIFPKMPELMKNADITEAIGTQFSIAGRVGASWGSTGGEAKGILSDNCLSADGIENVIKVLSDLEDERFQNLDFIELTACPGGCVGGMLTVENPYIARVKLAKLRKYLPVSGTRLDDIEINTLFRDGEIEYLPAFNLSDNISESIRLMDELDEILKTLPNLDCGCCGSPTCRAFAEDIVRGGEGKCIYSLIKGT
ncbi:MAG: 4Fe-4S dicluster domain-containing protein [Oscillospiraceae bacterium]|nr:4Fe-4S dicluster domain-containing protein [Oscillospiraceae bacterium]